MSKRTQPRKSNFVLQPPKPEVENPAELPATDDPFVDSNDELEEQDDSADVVPARRAQARFVSKRPYHKIIIRPTRVLTLPNGQIQVTPGKAAVFENGSLVTDDLLVIEFLRSYKRNGLDYVEA